MNNIQTLPVIFRAEKSGPFKGDVTAVFPTLDAGAGMVTTYARVGQHSGGCREWYDTTRAADPYEYADLLAELRGIYETGPDAVRLVVRQRWTQAMNRQRA